MCFTCCVNPQVIQDVHTFLESLFEQAVSLGASDIHIDPHEQTVHIRMRVSGMLHEHKTISKNRFDICIGKIKVLSSLRSDVHDRTQDGRFYFTAKSGERIDMRVSIAPTFFGENCVLRLLRSHNRKRKSFFELGMTEVQTYHLKQALSKSSGLVIVAGPTGSGKTSTLYSVLQYLSTGIDDDIANLEEHMVTDKNIVTIEDPVESVVSKTRQIQVSPDTGFGFKEALKGILRQDPDVVMIGEIRDKDTALAAIQTALTGHLVLTTIHAPNASSIIPRLIDMGIEPYLISSSVSLILSQRLVRVFDYNLGLYGDRVGVFEIVPVDVSMRELIHQRKTPYEIEKHISDSGHVLLRDACRDIYSRHVTTEEEINRINLDIFL